MTTRPIWKQTAVQASAILARWLLGALFIYMGANKALHPEAFLKLVRQYDIVTNSLLLNSIAATLPWFEVFCGLLLVSGVAVRGSALMLVAMLVPFTFVVYKRALAIASIQAIAFCSVKFDCGCGTGEVLICRKLVENSLLILLAAWLVFSRRHALCARFSFFESRK
jgi:putative oxidoreductase